MKTFLRSSLMIFLVFLLIGCTLPEITPVATPSAENPPTSTAPVVPSLSTTTETSVSLSDVITASNASQLKAADRSANSNVQELVWSLDSRSLMQVSQNSSNGTDQVFGAASVEVPSLAPRFVYAAPPGSQRMAASPDGKTVAVIAKDTSQVTLVDAASGKTLQTLAPGFGVMMASFSPDGKSVVVTAWEDWKANLYDVAAGKKLQEFTGFVTAAPVFDAGFAGNNKWVVWHARNLIMLQDTATGVLSEPFNHEDFFNVFTLSADGSMLASASMKTIDGVFTPIVYLWDTASGAFVRPLVLDSPGTALSFSPDGTLLAVAVGGAIQIWDVANEKLLATLMDNPNPIYDLAFSPDGRWLASSGNDNQLILWTVMQ